jgi:hypothetical protein
MDLTTFPIISDTTFYTVWDCYTAADGEPDKIGQLKPCSVYENVHPELFEIIGEATVN